MPTISMFYGILVAMYVLDTDKQAEFVLTVANVQLSH